MSGSELAPFVAACLRDRVTADLLEENQTLQRENRQLKRTLHERNPRRSVQLAFAASKKRKRNNKQGKMVRDSVLHLRNASTFMHMHFTFLTRGPRVEGESDLLAFRLKDIPRLELWIDGGLAVRFREDLDFFYQFYTYHRISGDSYDYCVHISARQAGLDLKLVVHSISPLEHAQLLQRETVVDFTPPENPDSDRILIDPSSWDDREGTPISIDRLVQLFGGGKGREVTAWLNDWQCTGRYFFQHLQVPYVRDEDD